MLLSEAKAIKRRGIWGLVLACTLVFIFITFILNIINAIKIMTTDWKNQELESDSLMWGIFSIVLLGPIAGIIFGSKAVNILKYQGTEVQASTTSNTTSTNQSDSEW